MSIDRGWRPNSGRIGEDRPEGQPKLSTAYSVRPSLGGLDLEETVIMDRPHGTSPVKLWAPFDTMVGAPYDAILRLLDLRTRRIAEALAPEQVSASELRRDEGDGG